MYRKFFTLSYFSLGEIVRLSTPKCQLKFRIKARQVTATVLCARLALRAGRGGGREGKWAARGEAVAVVSEEAKLWNIGSAESMVFRC